MNATQVSSNNQFAMVIGIGLTKDHCEFVGYDANNKICLTK